MQKLTLSNDQQKALKSFEDFISSDQKEFVLTGSAGSGKTTVVKEFIDTLHTYNEAMKLVSDEYRHYTPNLSALTHKASEVMNNTGMQPYCKTLHSTLGLKVFTDYKTGQVKVTKSKNSVVLNRDFLFVDEATMADPYLVKIVRESVHDGKIIWIGDRFQLNPVNARANNIFTKGSIHHYCELTENHRQKGAEGIFHAAEYVKHAINKELDPHDLVIPTSESVVSLSKEEFKRVLTTIPEDPADDHRIIAYTNRVVNQYNDFVHSRYSNYVPEPGYENVPAPGGYYANNPVYLDSHNPDKGFLVNTEGKVMLNHTPQYAYSTQILTIFDDITAFLNMPHSTELHFNLAECVNYRGGKAAVAFPKDPALFFKVKKAAKKVKNWHFFYLLDRMVPNLRLPYAITAHKSQGSTYGTVYIDVADILSNKKRNETLRLLYVAISRAKCKVYLYEGKE